MVNAPRKGSQRTVENEVQSLRAERPGINVYYGGVEWELLMANGELACCHLTHDYID